MKNKKNAKSWLKTETNWLWLQEDCSIVVRMYEIVSKTSAMIYFPMPNAQIWSFLAANCPKPSEILRIAWKRCFHPVPRSKNVLCTNFQPKNDDFDFLTCIWGPSWPRGLRGGAYLKFPKHPRVIVSRIS